MNKKTLVVKLGTSVLTGGTSRLDMAHMVELVRQCAHLHQNGYQIVVVSSGAIAAGREHLGRPDLAANIANKQMLAAVGQSQLILAWERLFNIYGLHVGQMLLTRADLEDRERFLNARDTLRALLAHRIIPIINENDAVAIAEIKVGDNDNLSAMVAVLAEADKLLLLTDQSGLFDADPRSNPNAKLIHEVTRIDNHLRQLAGDSVSGLGTGGMATKLQAAEIACRAGVETVIAAGRETDVINRIAGGECLGTRFIAQQSPLESRKRWILAGPSPAGRVVIDAGAVRAVRERGSSLLPKGIRAVYGHFSRGDVIRLYDEAGGKVGRGISRYASDELEKLKGVHSDEIVDVLGYGYGAVAIHRDDLVLL